jgi:catechol 2,3-dioxygenase-like lactoylglutathione lyase family enzyme
MFGRFLEISLVTDDIAASVAWYEQLGFRQLPCTDAWSWPYCALSDGRLCIGLHQTVETRIAISFVRPGLAAAVQALEFSGFIPHTSRLGFEEFHRLELRDPSGQDFRLLEARTCSPDTEGYRESQCGYFAAFSMPVTDDGATGDYWARAGFIAHEEESLPYPHRPLTSNHLNLRLHQRQALAQPALVFIATDMTNRLERLRALDLPLARRVPFGLDNAGNGLLQAPEGTQLLLVAGED